MSTRKLTGLAFIGGLVLLIIAVLVDPSLVGGSANTEIDNPRTLLGEMLNSPGVGHIATLLSILSIAASALGLYGLWHTVKDRGDHLFGIGIIATTIALVILWIAGSFRHITLHVAGHGDTMGLAQDEAIDLAVGTLLVQSTLNLLGGQFMVIGVGLISLALARRLSRGAFRTMSGSVSAISFLSLIAIIIFGHNHDWAHLWGPSIIAGSLVAGVFFTALGVALFKENKSLAPGI